MTSAREQAREAYAAALEGQGPSWSNAANSVRSGYSNAWIQAGIDALTPFVLLSDDAEGEEAGRTETAHR